MKHVSLDRVADIIKECAAQEVRPRFRRLAAHEVSEKSGPADLVTVADQAMERVLSAALTALLPGSQVLGEEAVAAGTQTVDILARTDAPVWIIDPIDGTKNFVDGVDDYGTLCALYAGGAVRQAWIYLPEHNVMTMGAEGEGVMRNGAPVRVSAARSVSGARGFCGCKIFKTVRQRFPDLFARHERFDTLNCCAVEYDRMLQGQSDYVMYRVSHPWDHAAGSLLVPEAGGVNRTWDGADYRPGMTRGLLATATEELWRDVYDRLIVQIKDDDGLIPKSLSA